MSTYEPGRMYVMRTLDGREFRVVRHKGGSNPDYWSAPTDWPLGVSAEDCEFRPLVVLDLSAAEFTIRALSVAATSLDRWCGYEGEARAVRDLIDQIREQTKPPKPAEPTGLGAVVEDAEGVRWTHPNLHPRGEWFSECGDYEREYADIDAVRILSDGLALGDPRDDRRDARPRLRQLRGHVLRGSPWALLRLPPLPLPHRLRDRRGHRSRDRQPDHL